MAPCPLGPHSSLHGINTYGVEIESVVKKIMVFIYQVENMKSCVL